MAKTKKADAVKVNKRVTYRPELVEQNIILSVRHLKQFFKFGHGANAFKTKAVHDVSFDIYKGECFGLVGESGCGKTTTGRSLIRLYDITSGSIYFKGYRISAGHRWNDKEKKWTKVRGKNKIKLLNEQKKDEIELLKDTTGLLPKLKEFEARLVECDNKMDLAKSDHKDALRIASQADDEIEAKQLKTKADEEFEKRSAAIDEEYASLKNEIKAIVADMDKYKKEHSDSKIDEESKAKIAEVEAKYDAEIAAEKKHIADVVAEQNKQIKKIKYDNKHVSRKLMSKMQMIFQDPVDSLDPRMTVEDIIQEGLRIQGHNNSYENSQKVKEVLEQVGLIPEYASRYPHEFSGGQRQRIGIARALVMNPEFLICDEPISALDVSIRAQIINLLNDLKQELGLTLLFIAHDLSVVKYFCDRIAVMYYGEIVELTTSDELFKHPLHPYTNALLSAIPKPDPLSEKTRQRIIYNPSKEHDYSVNKPHLVEIIPSHFVLGNEEEIAKYREKIAKIDSAK